MMRVHIFRVALMLWIAVWGCDGKTPLQPLGTAEGREPSGVEPGPMQKTTSERIAVTNLNASVQAARRKLAARLDVDVASVLVEQLLLRADFYRSFDDWEEATEVSRTVLEAYPNDPEALLLRARVHNTLHEFDAALALVDEARALGLDRTLEAQATHLAASIGLARDGAPDEIIARHRVLAGAIPTYQNVTSLALALAKHGRFAEADAAFRNALENYRDVSPFPFAWVAFQRGVMWSEQADRPDLGRPLYEEALRYLPGYVLANVHLAELDAQEGRLAAAIERVSPLVGTTQDPEPLVLLATLVPSVDLAQRYAAEADAAYRHLIERFPEAFGHHVRY